MHAKWVCVVVWSVVQGVRRSQPAVATLAEVHLTETVELEVRRLLSLSNAMALHRGQRDK